MKRIKKEYYLIAILLILFVFLTIFVMSGKTLMIDETVFNKIINFKSDKTTTFLYWVTSLASSVGLLILLLVTFIIFLRKKSISDFKYIVINVFTGIVLMQGLKLLIQRTRPVWKWITEDGFSYPSGHTITAFLFFGTLILLISKKVTGKKRTILITILSILIVLTGLSRIYFGVHYLTDVVASIILGSIILIISNIFMNKEFDNNDKNKTNKAV